VPTFADRDPCHASGTSLEDANRWKMYKQTARLSVVSFTCTCQVVVSKIVAPVEHEVPTFGYAAALVLEHRCAYPSNRHTHSYMLWRVFVERACSAVCTMGTGTSTVDVLTVHVRETSIIMTRVFRD
jgi:hypothetical protein